MEDSSRRFVLRGGPHDGMTVRLYPHNDGHHYLAMPQANYIAPMPDDQDERKPYLLWEN